MMDTSSTPRPNAEDDLRSLTERLARVQATILDPVKLTDGDERFDKKGRGGVKRYRFADLVTVLQTVRPLLAKEGLALVQLFDNTASEIRVVSQLRYGAAVIESTWSQPLPPMPMDRNGQPMAMGLAQQIGACATYARRKALLALVGVQDDEQDDPDLGAGPEEPRKDEIREKAQARAAEREPGLASMADDDLGPLLAQTLRMLSDMAVRNDYAIDKRAALQACLDKRGWPEPTRERLESLQAALLDPSKEEALMKIIKPHLSQRQTQREATQVEVERAAAAWAEANMMHNVVEDYYVRDMITALATDLGQDLGAMTPKAWAVQLARFQDPKQTPTLQALFAGVFVPF